MAIKFKSAGVNARIINLTGPTDVEPQGTPAGIIGTSQKGKAYVPTTLATNPDFLVSFGAPTDNANHAPLAVSEWLRNSQAANFTRVLGIGKGEKRTASGLNQGKVERAGFIVGDQQPQGGGGLGDNPKSNAGGPLGRTYFLGAIMSQSNNSSIFSEAGLPQEGAPIVRGVVMAASGVNLALSSSWTADNHPDSSAAAGTADVGAVTGSVNLSGSKQEFVMVLNGHKNQSTTYPNVITASFDVNASNYFKNMFNTDPLKLEEAGHYLYADYVIHPNLAAVTGSGVVAQSSGSNNNNGLEQVAFLVSGSQTRNSGSTTAPNFENFEDRFKTPESPYVISQKFGGSPENLFRVVALHDGTFANNQIKISIENIIPSTSDVNPYGSFDLLVRDLNDTDKNPRVLEAWRGLNLDPESPRYVGKIIGDYNTFYNFDSKTQKLVTEGFYANKSRYIRVDIPDKVENGEIDASALPVGMRGAPHLVTSGSAPLPQFSDNSYFTKDNLFYDVVQMPVPFREHIKKGNAPNETVDKGLYWGVQFERKISATSPNSTTKPESTIKAFTSYFPDFHTDFQNVLVSNNHGTPDTTENGILDADRFNNNLFTLENIKVKYDTSTDIANTQQLVSWSYVRGGNIATDVSNKQRAFKVSDLEDPSVRQVSKFSFFLQGGFDGVRIFNEDTKNLTNNAIVEEMDNTNRGTSNGATVSAYNKALDIISDETEVDIQLLTTPGIRHSIITDRGLQITEDRFDALYLMDVEQYDTLNTLVTASNLQTISVTNTINQFRNRGLNTSFGSAYFPDVVMRDEINGVVRQVPPTVAVLGAFSRNDAIGFPWYAPAGFARGALETTERAAVKLSRNNLDSLVSNDINPIVSFAGSDGVLVWGQNTLLASDSALERVNVRRLLIDLRRKVKSVALRMVFEPTREETLARFSQLVNPILKKVQNQNGVSRYLVQINADTTTQADIENGVLRGVIWLQPRRSLEFLSLDFQVTNEGGFSQG